MKIADVIVYPTSFRLAPEEQVSLGVGATVKRDAVVVKVVTEDGIVGWGEAHHGRAPGAVAHLVATTIRDIILGQDALDVVGIWNRVYERQLRSHGMGAAASMALSGVDMALWDIRGKVAGMPLHTLLGGAARPIPAYAGGISLGHQPVASLVEEAEGLIAAGYRALKLRVGDSPANDIERVGGVRAALGDDIDILADANTAYSVADAREVLPAFEDMRVGWLEEPFAPHDHRSYRAVASTTSVPLASGENHYTRFEFHRVIEDGAISILQPDLSKSGGITEAQRIAALGSPWKLSINPHSSATGINMAASVHFLCAIDNGGYFEADVAKVNLFREELGSQPFSVHPDGTVLPLDKPGIGVEVDEDFLQAHPVIDGPSYV